MGIAKSKCRARSTKCASRCQITRDPIIRQTAQDIPTPQRDSPQTSGHHNLALHYLHQQSKMENIRRRRYRPIALIPDLLQHSHAVLHSHMRRSRRLAFPTLPFAALGFLRYWHGRWSIFIVLPPVSDMSRLQAGEAYRKAFVGDTELFTGCYVASSEYH